MQLPRSIETERAVLGAVIVDNRLGRFFAELETDDFYHMPHQTIYRTTQSLLVEGKPVDPVTLFSALGDDEKRLVGGMEGLNHLADELPTTANFDHYLNELREIGRRRAMMQAAMNIVDEGGKQSIDTPDFLARARAAVTGVADQQTKNANAISVASLIDSTLQELEEQGEPAGLIKTGIGTIDAEFGGLWPGLLSVLASRPSMGKSTLALNIAANAALSGKHVLIVSPEDSRRFVMYRLFARFANVALERIVSKRLSFGERTLLRDVRDIIGCLPAWIDDTPSITSVDVRNIAFRHADEHGLDLLVIDHLGHLRDKGKDLYESTTAAARTIVEIPKQLNIPVLCLHQLSRETEKRSSKIPELGDLRQTGELEQLARVVWLLHRPRYYDESKDENELTFIIAKNSHGRTGKLRLHCDLQHMHVGDYQRAGEAEY
jgi:replicative DNA helicase